MRVFPLPKRRFKALQLLWLEPLVAVIIIAFAAYVIFKSTQSDINESLAKRVAIGLISLAAVTLVILFISLSIIEHRLRFTLPR